MKLPDLILSEQEIRAAISHYLCVTRPAYEGKRYMGQFEVTSNQNVIFNVRDTGRVA